MAKALIMGTLLQSALCSVCLGQPLNWQLTGRNASASSCMAMRFDSPGALVANGRGDLYIAGEKGDAALQVLRADGSRQVLLDRRQPLIQSGHYTGISLALDSGGSVYLAVKDRGTIEKIDPNGTLTNVAGKPGDLRPIDGPASSGRFKELIGIATSQTGDIYVIDRKAIRKISLNSTISTFAGDLEGAYPEVVGPKLNKRDGTGTAARFVHPSAVAISSRGDIYVADGYRGYLEGNTESVTFIRNVSKEGVVTPFAGNYPGDIDDQGAEAGIGFVFGMAFDIQGNLYLAEHDDHSVRKVDPDANVITLLSRKLSRDAAPYPWAPSGIAASPNGVVYVSGTEEGQLYRIKERGRVEVLCTSSEAH